LREAALARSPCQTIPVPDSDSGASSAIQTACCRVPPGSPGVERETGGLLKEIVPRLSRIAIFGITGLAAQFAATETAVRALALEAEIMECGSARRLS